MYIKKLQGDRKTSVWKSQGTAKIKEISLFRTIPKYDSFSDGSDLKDLFCLESLKSYKAKMKTGMKSAGTLIDKH